MNSKQPHQLSDRPCEAGSTESTALRDRLIYRPELLDLIGLSYPTIWRMMRAGTFPRHRAVTRCGSRVAWIAIEIHDWIKGLPIQRLKGDQETPEVTHQTNIAGSTK